MVHALAYAYFETFLCIASSGDGSAVFQHKATTTAWIP